MRGSLVKSICPHDNDDDNDNEDDVDDAATISMYMMMWVARSPILCLHCDVKTQLTAPFSGSKANQCARQACVLLL